MEPAVCCQCRAEERSQWEPAVRAILCWVEAVETEAVGRRARQSLYDEAVRLLRSTPGKQSMNPHVQGKINKLQMDVALWKRSTQLLVRKLEESFPHALGLILQEVRATESGTFDVLSTMISREHRGEEREGEKEKKNE